MKRFNGKQEKLHLAGDSVDEMQMTLRQRILDFLLDPNIAFLVLAVGALALYAEFNHPGAIVPGVVGVVFILLALFALNLLPTRYASFTLIIAAFVLFVLEAKFATHGILGLGGIVLLDSGRIAAGRWADPADACELVDSAGSQRSPRRDHRVSDEHSPSRTAQQGRDRLARTDRRDRAGAHRHRSGGKVFVLGELWNAHAPSRVGMGEQVVVRKVEGLELEVEKAAISS